MLIARIRPPKNIQIDHDADEAEIQNGANPIKQNKTSSAFYINKQPYIERNTAEQKADE